MEDGVVATQLGRSVAVVTGAARGLGLVLAQALGAAGARVFITGRTQEAVDAALQTLRGQGIEAAGTVADVTASGVAKATLDKVVQTFGRIDILVNNAGHYGWRGFLEVSEAEWQETLTTNLTAPFLWTQEFARHIITQGGGGVVVNIGSVHGIVTDPRAVAQCASKAGLHALTKSTADALRPHGIRVNAVAPGSILYNSPDVHAIGPEAKVTQGDVAQMVVFLASAKASAVTGVVLEAFGATHTMLVEA